MSLPPEIPQRGDRTNAEPTTASELANVHREMTGFERSTIRLAKIAVGVSVLAAIFVWLQWKEMRAGGVDTHDLAEAAKKQADVTQSEERPYMVAEAPRFVKPPTVGQPIWATDFVRNIGRTPAIKIITNAKFVRYFNSAKSRPTVFAYLDDVFNDLKIKDIQDRNEPLIRKDLAPSNPFFRTEGDQIVSKSDLAKIEKDDLELFYVGLVTYGDSFGGYYETEYCFFYIGNNPTVWHMCDSHNTIQ